MLALLYYAGMRLNEILNLKWQDIDFMRLTIHIKKAKGGKDRIVFLHKQLKHFIESNGIKKEGSLLLSERGDNYREF